MDFTTRSAQSRGSSPARLNPQAPQPVNSGVRAGGNNGEGKRRQRFSHRWFQVSSVVLLFSGTILVVAVLLFINIGGPSPENKYVNTKEYQAVVINDAASNSDQAYFGHITGMSDQYIHLTNVFYVQNQGQNSASNAYNLIKLGCELHGPEDAMIINRDQVLYWENLKTSGQVTQKISEWYKQNPNGQNCSTSNASNSTTQQTAPAAGSPSSSTNNSAAGGTSSGSASGSSSSSTNGSSTSPSTTPSSNSTTKKQ